jgi:hypothetical protein
VPPKYVTSRIVVFLIAAYRIVGLATELTFYTDEETRVAMLGE